MNWSSVGGDLLKQQSFLGYKTIHAELVRYWAGLRKKLLFLSYAKFNDLWTEMNFALNYLQDLSDT